MNIAYQSIQVGLVKHVYATLSSSKYSGSYFARVGHDSSVLELCSGTTTSDGRFVDSRAVRESTPRFAAVSALISAIVKEAL